jgi:hypothetical protein
MSGEPQEGPIEHADPVGQKEGPVFKELGFGGDRSKLVLRFILLDCFLLHKKCNLDCRSQINRYSLQDLLLQHFRCLHSRLLPLQGRPLLVTPLVDRPQISHALRRLHEVH